MKILSIIQYISINRKNMAIYKILILSLYLWSPNLSILWTHQIESIHDSIATLAFSLFFMLFPLILFTKIRSYFLLFLPLTLLIPPFIYIVIKYRSIPSDALTSAIIHTGFNQTLEMTLAFGWIILIIPLSTLIYWKVATSLSQNLRLSSTHRKSIFLGLLIYVLVGIGNRHLLPSNFQTPPLLDESTANLTFPTSIFLSISRNIAYENKTNNIVSVHGKIVGNARSPLVVVLVIGESCRNDHLGLNGYYRNTTPRLSSLGTSLLSFTDVASTANWTYGALQNISWKNENGKRYSLIQTFRELGFETAWISNQEFSPYGQGANLTHYSNLNFRTPNDMTLLPPFNSFLNQAGEMQFIVLHMYGSHIPYDERYSPRAKLFAPTLADIGVSEIPLSNQKAAAINSYDNTIVQMDIFLAQVIDELSKENRPSLMFYTSDHGENLFDDKRNLFMHTQFPPTQFDTHVPLLVWANSTYKNGHAEVFSALKGNLGKKISHTDLFATLLSMASIEWEGSIPEENFASPAFKEKKRKILTVRSDPLDFETLK